MRKLVPLLPALILAALHADPAAGQAAVALRAGDAVRLVVRDEPSLGGDYPVAESGVVLLPEIGFVTVGGRAFGDVDREVQSRYGRVLVDPEILLIPLLRIAVLGEVRQPGLITVDPTQALPDVLAVAGGMTAAADPGRIVIVRDGRELRLRLAAGDRGLGERIQSGDQILVGRRGWMRENMGAVVGAGASVLVAAVTALLIR